ncbi:MAG TPA: hypothetical protein VFI42_16655 [Thermomicrobiaceae bacterium]|nr:hypothetical protein [Thermomicrobiaceae bacterium]
MEHDRRLQRLAELATLPGVPVGTRVRVAEDGYGYIGLGQTRPEIAARLGWTQANVWMPEHVERYVLRQHQEIRRPIEASAYLLGHPDAVSEDPQNPALIRFLIGASAIRSAGFIASRTMTFIDLLVELRRVDGEVLLRAFHLAPATQGRTGTARWP